MNHTIFLILILLTGFNTIVKAQTKLAPQVTASSGQRLQNSEVSVDFTLGEPITQTIGSDPKLTQGFQQPGLEVMIRVVDPLFNDKCKIYPNPANDILNVVIDERSEFELTLYDLKGIAHRLSRFVSAEQIHLADLPPGSYVITVTKQGATIFSGIIEKTK